MASLAIGPGKQARWREQLLKIALATLTALILAALVHGQGPPWTFRTGNVPETDLTARIAFEFTDTPKTQAAREAAEQSVPPVLVNQPEPILELATRFKADLRAALSTDPATGWARELARSWNSERSVWIAIGEKLATLSEPARQAVFEQLTQAFDELAARGLLGPVVMSPGLRKAGQYEIRGQASGEIGLVLDASLVDADQVNDLTSPIAEAFIENFPDPDLGLALYEVLRDPLSNVSTLRFDPEATERRRAAAKREVIEQVDSFAEGDLLVARGDPITPSTLLLLRGEYESYLNSLSWTDRLVRILAILGLTSGLVILVGSVLVRLSSPLAYDLRGLAGLCGLAVLCLVAVRLAAPAQLGVELLPLALTGLILAVGASTVVALVLVASLGTLSALALGEDVATLTVLIGSVSLGVLGLDAVRTRTKLIRVSGLIGLGAVVLTLASGTLSGEPWPLVYRDALWRLGCGVMAGFILSGLLPFLESRLGLVTGISLLELGDMSHPLLRELIQRAPGTHNHSMTVAVLAEAAAKQIDADTTLVRVGAYFHDIGKMLKPNYFIENQMGQPNRHNNLAPAMSTLIIIGHVKDGVDLGRQHHLPSPIIDLIEQHHGTTLVEYFYHEATKRANGSGPIPEGSFRYPGPKPQSREAAILMMADMVESASRTLSDPTPARIEALVRKLINKRLHDDQFDECPITLQEIGTIRESLIKSLNGVYHGRVAYPEQKRPA